MNAVQPPQRPPVTPVEKSNRAHRRAVLHAKELRYRNRSLLDGIHAVAEELRRHSDCDMIATAKHARALLRLLADGHYGDVRGAVLEAYMESKP